MLVACLASALTATAAAAQDPVEPQPPTYNQDIRPLLAENCFACHGQDASHRKAGLSLQLRASAVGPLAGGGYAIVPGRPQQSVLVRRIVSADREEVMPPAASGKHLSALQIQTLIRWIADGATYQAHWAYTAPVAVVSAQPQRNLIDAFIQERLAREQLTPSPPADRSTLIRRLSFDLIGLPPTSEEVAAFVADPSEACYQRTVDRLLASPHYGERMAVSWLDLVRFADTIGYHSDNPRNVAPYRDWVINAFNANMPFDQFTREQLAGDLLPGASLQQRVASGYNRLIMTTEEGGAQAREYESKSAADRVRNLSAVWLGSTMQCCECHDHKFDPFSQRDFYAMEAFFADIQEPAIGPREAGEPVPTPAEQAQLEALARDIDVQATLLATETPALAADQAHWEAGLAAAPLPVLGTWWHLGPFLSTSAHLAFTTAYDPESRVDTAATRSDHLAWTPEPAWQDGEVHHFSGDNAAVYLTRTIASRSAQSLHLSLGSDDTITLWLDGHLALAHEISRGVAADQEQLDLALTPGSHRLLIKICNGGGDFAYYFKSSAAIPAEIQASLALPASARSPLQLAALAAYYRGLAPALAGARSRLLELQHQRDAALAQVPRCLVTTSGAPRVVTIKARGNWMDDHGAVCQPAVPHFLAQLDGAGRATRLDLANWLVGDANPLVARVLVNRLWKQCFGVGLVRTMGDFGTQGDAPSHPELLDSLACDLQRHGWDLKRTLRLLVCSSTYRESSQASAVRDRDPENRLLSHQGCFRLDAEFVRDEALAISGLLVTRVGGPSVRPYQPAGYLMHLNFPPRDWVDDQGDDAYRRGLYTFWQRSFLHPSLLAFDAPAREECSGERARSNTPQQALVLLNDPTFVEAARAFAERILTAGGDSDLDHLRWAYQRALSRAPSVQETALLRDFLATQRTIYRTAPQAADALLTVGFHAPPRDLDHGELAVWTATARMLLNLHETITRN